MNLKWAVIWIHNYNPRRYRRYIRFTSFEEGCAVQGGGGVIGSSIHWWPVSWSKGQPGNLTTIKLSVIPEICMYILFGKLTAIYTKHRPLSLSHQPLTCQQKLALFTVVLKRHTLLISHDVMMTLSNVLVMTRYKSTFNATVPASCSNLTSYMYCIRHYFRLGRTGIKTVFGNFHHEGPPIHWKKWEPNRENGTANMLSFVVYVYHVFRKLALFPEMIKMTPICWGH